MAALYVDILSPPQRRLWDELGDVPPGFTLYGGTEVVDLPTALTAAGRIYPDSFNP